MLDLDRYKVRKAYRILIHDESDVAFNFVDRILKYPKDRQDVDKLFRNYCNASRTDDFFVPKIKDSYQFSLFQKRYLNKLWDEHEYDLFYKKYEEFKTGTYIKTK